MDCFHGHGVCWVVDDGPERLPAEFRTGDRYLLEQWPFLEDHSL